ncbi:ABC transporter substrate-binding protein [Actinomadura xylanilytica]|uniref:ABC transporter substrate-binding protein n=1 Tax=Actinomadura xylanilytica TaxID=887459 RepID=UPI00255AB08B|nr:ABC transporter substrate-binding protein [Actinomadura xylanilytica]MDL4775015.1 ABC transporter substrate-binding protein [Actinomadura xylanilytica]
MAEITPLRTGDPGHLGPYRLTGLLGEGGQGSVYLAEVDPAELPDVPPDDDVPEDTTGPERDAASGQDSGAMRQVAVKLLHARFSGDPRARSRFAAELKVARRVSPFCTARILDADVEGDRPYIVSEYIDGPPLSAVLSADGPRRGAELDRVAIGTMTALAAIHQAGVVHRDFKPANVLLAQGGPRVIDFGIARALDATGTLSSTAVGTPAYMAPEQISGAPVGPKADVFAWGATMVYAAGGRAAFGQDSIPAVMHRILNLPPDLGALAEPLRSLVADCLGKDPAARPSSHQVLLRLLSLAGSLPQTGGGPGDPQSAAVLNQGAEAAATSTRLRQIAARPQQPFGQAAGRSLYAPPPPSPPLPGGGAPGGQLPGGRLPGQQHPGQPLPGGQYPAQPPLPGQHLPGQQPPGQQPPGNGLNRLGGQWPPPESQSPLGPAPFPGEQGNWQQPSGAGVQMTKPSSGLSGKRGIGVLAGAGGAALVALIIVAAVVIVQMRQDDRVTPAFDSGRTGGEFRASLTALGDGGELDPSHSMLGTRKFVSKQLFTGLTEIAPDGTARNRLATAITPDATCTRWRISIKPGTRFSNGEPVDAAAFARGWARSAGVSGSAAPYLMDDIKGFAETSSKKSQKLAGVQAAGGTLQVELTGPNCEFAARLADPVFSPVPSGAGGPDNGAYNMNPVGNGPFKVGSYQKEQTLTLVRNDAWAFGKTRLDRVSIRLSTSGSAVGRAGIAAGTLDWAPLGPEELATTRGMNGLMTHTSPFTRMLIPLTQRGPLRSKEARLAVSYALDRQAISNTLYGGVYQPARGIVPRPVPGFAGARDCPACGATDPAKARSLAGQAGQKPGTKVTLFVQDTQTYRRAAEVIAQRLQQVLGWRIELKTTVAYKFDEQRKLLTAEDASGLLLYAWGPDYPAPYTMLRPLLAGDQVATTGNRLYNFAGWRNARFDELLAQAIRTPDNGRRTGLLQQAEKTALDDMALVPLLNDGTAALSTGKFVGLQMDYEGDPTLATTALK